MNDDIAARLQRHEKRIDDLEKRVFRGDPLIPEMQPIVDVMMSQTRATENIEADMKDVRDTQRRMIWGMAVLGVLIALVLILVIVQMVTAA